MTDDQRAILIAILASTLDIAAQDLTQYVILVRAKTNEPCPDCGEMQEAIGIIARPNTPMEVVDLLDRGIKDVEEIIKENPSGQLID